MVNIINSTIMYACTVGIRPCMLIIQLILVIIQGLYQFKVHINSIYLHISLSMHQVLNWLNLLGKVNGLNNVKYCCLLINSYVGEFGIVYKGYIVKEHAQLQGSVITDTVAIKTLKGIQILCIL